MRYQPQSEIINIEPWVLLAQASIQEYCLEPDEHDKWRYEDALYWVRHYFDDLLNAHLQWARGSDQAKSYLEHWCEQHDFVFDQNRFLDALESVRCLIEETIERFSADNAWWIWITRYRGDYIVMEYGGDYRIHVFHEKLDAGEWTLD